MKLRRLIALLMAALMLLAMIPAAKAQAIWCPDLGWEHAWSTPEYDYGPCEWGFRYCTRCGAGSEVPPQHKWVTQTIEQPDCTEPGWKESLCANCGDEKGDRQEIPALGHNWGSWRWVHGEPPCNSNGAWQVRDCQRCGQQEDRWIEGGAHAFGPWYSTQEPTCMAPGRQEHTCTLCGHTEWTTLPQMDHVFGEWRVVEEPQVGLPGYERRFCIYQCGTYEEREIPPLEEAISQSGLALTLVLSSTPANGTHFVVGEKVTFTETWVNNTDQTLYPFSVSIFTCAAPAYGSAVDQISSWFAEDAGGPVAPGASGSHMLTVTVTEADVARGAIYAMAELLSTVQDGPDLGNVATPFVTALCGSTDNAAAAPCLTVDMTYTNTPANGEFFTPGEVINYLITVTNTGDVPLTNLQVGNSASEAVVPAPSEIAPGQTIQVPYYKLVYEENAKAGGIDSYGHANAFNGDPALPESLVSARSADVFVPCGKGDGSPSVYYLKIVANAPANGLFFTEGETIKYRLSFGNNTKKDIYNITLNDPMANTRSVAFARRLKAGEFLMGEFEYVVTAADVAAGQIVNTGTSTWATKAEGAQTTTPSNTVVTPCGSDNSDGSGLVDGLTFTKSVTSTPVNGAYYVPGEDIHFLITVNNDTGKELDVIVLTDPLSASFYHEIEAVPAGESVSRSLSYTVTEFDAEIGNVTNYAYAVAYVDGKPHSMTSNSVTVPCNFHDTDGDGEPDEPYGIHTWLDVTKEVESLPMNGHFYVEGETVAYKITFTNAGESVLMDVRIYDALVGMAEIATAEYMEPGDSRVCYLNYTVTAEDAQRGDITNTAIGQYVMHGYVNTFYSNEVTVQTNYFKNVIFTPDVTEDPGTIDPGKLPLGESSCVRTITGKDNASASYETTFCADHVATQSSVMLMTQAATTPEAQVQAATYAATLWRTEAEKLYQQLLDAADNQGKITVMTEYIRFAAMATNYEIVLKNIYPDQPALVAQLIAKLWEDKCVTLCYEIHTAADARTDSLLSVTATTGAAAHCACTVTAETAGTKAYTQSFCAAHAFPFSMIDMLLQGQDTADSWATVRQIWMVELNGTYNKVNTVLAGNSDLALAEFNATMQWLEAREAYLNALYPDNPELMAQIMVKHIMDRVNDLCPALK